MERTAFDKGMQFFFVSLLRGSKQKKVLYVLNKKALWGYYNLLGLQSRSSVEALLDELIKREALHYRKCSASLLAPGYLAA
ncbi:MAG: hypothetical protein ACYCYE_00705 [Clostridia bacterium]